MDTSCPVWKNKIHTSNDLQLALRYCNKALQSLICASKYLARFHIFVVIQLNLIFINQRVQYISFKTAHNIRNILQFPYIFFNKPKILTFDSFSDMRKLYIRVTVWETVKVTWYLICSGYSLFCGRFPATTDTCTEVSSLKWLTGQHTLISCLIISGYSLH